MLWNANEGVVGLFPLSSLLTLGALVGEDCQAGGQVGAHLKQRHNDTSENGPKSMTYRSGDGHPVGSTNLAAAQNKRVRVATTILTNKG